MSLSNSHLAYPDCIEAFDKAAEDSEGIRIKMHDYDSCIRFRMRCNQARSLQRQFNLSAFDKGHPMHGASLWDKLVVQVKQDGDQWYIYIVHIGLDMGPIEPLSGVMLEYQPPKALPAPTDDFAESKMVVEPIRRI